MFSQQGSIVNSKASLLMATQFRLFSLTRIQLSTIPSAGRLSSRGNGL